MFPFRKLKVWEKAHALTVRVYAVTDGAVSKRFPALVGQLRRAVASIPANIVEGAGHSTDPQFNKFLEIALASAHEVDYHLLLARDLDVISSKEYAHLEAQLIEVKRMLQGLRSRVLTRMGEKGKRGGPRASPPPT